MKEYVIEKQIKGCKPFFVREKIRTFEECCRQLDELIEYTKSSVSNAYYVINDFYYNEYPPTLKNLTTYTIKVREVSSFTIYTEKEDKRINKKIVNIFDYRI